jgi:phosphoserine phosphatase
MHSLSFLAKAVRLPQSGAMQGNASTYKASLKARLDIIHPSRQQVAQFISQHPPRLTPNVKALVAKLHERNVPVYLISGGFRCVIEPVATQLNIPPENVFTNELLFYYNGDYAGFDERQATCEGDGKSMVIKQLKTKFGYRQLVHIGDGVTDLEACPPADIFIGFGGNQVRERVRKECHWFVTDFTELIDALA